MSKTFFFPKQDSHEEIKEIQIQNVDFDSEEDDHVDVGDENDESEGNIGDLVSIKQNRYSMSTKSNKL